MKLYRFKTCHLHVKFSEIFVAAQVDEVQIPASFGPTADDQRAFLEYFRYIFVVLWYLAWYRYILASVNFLINIENYNYLY